ncbi:hypothetical protein NDN01_10065 [Sphingomonas sp. QA11]|uniref:hypothetical protein n=1 Tax=Sphingomonas sp. QA11 TaxID=2950605 RepID=UPI002349DB86|nr:hypothetical protein [Sphingomonas sp. QA11]WCM29199.1 hypothetical protein NDN01_10065 [Sphingomonas sp. QA11]
MDQKSPDKKQKYLSESSFSRLIFSTAFTGLIALGGVWLGSSLNGQVAKTSSDYTKLKEIRLSSYVDFANQRRIVIREWNPQATSQSAAAVQAEALMEQAATRIAVYGDESVIHSLANLWRTAPEKSAPCATGWKADLDVYIAMREEVFGNKPSSKTKSDIAEAIYRCTLDS